MFAFWWLLSAALDTRVLPPPHQVIAQFVVLAGSDLWRHAGASLARVLSGLAIATVTATPLGIAMGRSQRLDAVLRPVSYLLYPVPKIALLPVVLLLVGIGNPAKVLLLILVLFFQVLIAVRDAAVAVDERYVITMRSLGASRIELLRFVIWPNVLSRLLTSLRVGSATALAVLFFAETFFTKLGLGYYIVTQWTKVAYVDMFAGILALSLLGLLLFAAIDRMEKVLCPWIRRDGRRNS